jgi:anhydro-N-acetylmuramic acid kinase
MATSIFMSALKNSIGLGIMSGTSTDGIDLALCKFASDHDMELLQFESVTYSDVWRQKLRNAQDLDGQSLLLFSNDFTRFTANVVNEFIRRAGQKPDFIGAHGHTIFHQPGSGLTYQMLNGALLSAQTSTTVVCDFRTTDIALGGQGAPLVPIGDRLLFGQYDACVNLGGFANISFEEDSRRVAFDIGPANLALNDVANRVGQPYDAGGKMSSSGILIPALLDQLNSLAFYHAKPPKSLGREWLETAFNPVIQKFGDASPSNLGRTITEHIAFQTSKALGHFNKGASALFTGGGVHNRFLMQRIAALSPCNIEIPGSDISDGKEAIVFALLAKLRLEEKINTLASVTGASSDSSGGAVYLHI